MSAAGRFICYLTIAVCLACFWAGLAFLAHVALGLSVMAIPTVFTVALCVCLLALGLCGASADIGRFDR